LSICDHLDGDRLDPLWATTEAGFLFFLLWDDLLLLTSYGFLADQLRRIARKPLPPLLKVEDINKKQKISNDRFVLGGRRPADPRLAPFPASLAPIP